MKKYAGPLFWSNWNLEILEFVLRSYYNWRKTIGAIFNKPTIRHLKQLLDEVFLISRIIKVKVGVTSRRLRLIKLTNTLIILVITKTESNNCFIIH